MKWHYPVGLLYDLFSGTSPYRAQYDSMTKGDGRDDAPTISQSWRLKIHFTDWPEHALVRPDAEGKVIHDAFINSVKEADFLRNGTAKGIMSLSRDDSTALWNAVQERESKDSLRVQGISLTILEMILVLSILSSKGCSMLKAPHYATYPSRFTYLLRRLPLSLSLVTYASSSP